MHYIECPYYKNRWSQVMHDLLPMYMYMGNKW